MTQTIKQIIDYHFSSGCPLCGSRDIHACTGKPVVWTEEEEAELAKVMETIFEQNKETNDYSKTR